jgi:hypothetical protein
LEVPGEWRQPDGYITDALPGDESIAKKQPKKSNPILTLRFTGVNDRIAARNLKQCKVKK